jgi:hypothetical protein
MKVYAGIGSRKTPKKILEQMRNISSFLAKEGYILRSGGADGADSAFEDGCDLVLGQKEIYLPWNGFNGNSSSRYHISEAALEMASEIHPAWDSLSQGAKKLHARNCYQILGGDLNCPCNFVVCWTDGGIALGGTRTAIILAQKHNIPVINLAIEEFSIHRLSPVI